MRYASLRAKWAFFLLVSGGPGLFSAYTHADTDIFTVPDDPSTAKTPFTGKVEGSYSHQSGNTRTSTTGADSTMTWFRGSNAYSLWGEAYNYSSDDTRSSEKYQAGVRARHNLNANNFLFSQGSWLSDRFNGYRSRDTLVVGYGRQVFNGPVQNLRIEAGPGVRHDEYVGGGVNTDALAYGALTYTYQLTSNAHFLQGLSILGTRDTTVNSETGISVDLNKHFALKVTYDVTHNSKPPASAPKKTDTKTAVSIVYTM
ncbi:DUF481 domain-containing protein [Martelella alba]|uniref:DUF481 domain-containing protein n=1 Tax=Martelella alba TaxID=2590451 RepID=A0ABY2SJ57_9HYPH|nr:DUF481 domain-containing protein [Martelella alba]TKI05202.1 DUF481 domain-containing protein [Martelella alba]